MMGKNKFVMHIDMNSYFASVEQQANPFLRGKPLGVCSYLSPNGVIIASSIEAKKKGIKTGCKIKDAKILDPSIVVLENDPAKYRSTTKKIFKILSEYTDTLEPYSIDEAFLDLSGWTKDFSGTVRVAKEIQERIMSEVGCWLGSSVGISWTKFLAKFAGDIAPKKGIILIDDEKALIEKLKNRSLTDAWGINIRMEARLNSLGINDLLSLKDYDKDRIRRSLGRYGYYLWANMNGIEVESINRGVKVPKSIGHSYSVPKKTKDKEYLGKVLYKLCEKAGRRLRSLELEANRIQIGLAYVQEGGINRSFKTPEKLFTTEEIFYQANKFLESTELLLPVRLVAITVGLLSEVQNQMSLFEDNLGQKELSRAMDDINNKYGEFTVVRGRMFGSDDIARDRVGFRKGVEVGD